MAPGSYSFTVSSGGGFLGPNQAVTLDVRPGETATSKVALTRLFDPPASGWYAADLHHHADQAEGVTPPEYLARSQLAAGLDLLFVSDHDSTANHAPLQKIADARGVPFIPSLELSPSWGHFNAWPLRPSQQLAIDTATATIDEVLGEARRQGAIVVQSNHPFIPYGYLASLGAGLVPGGFNPAFDLAEINSDVPYDTAVLGAIWLLWNEGHRYYLAGGTDVHDVWNHESGRIRTFGHVDGPLTPVSYAEAVKNGHAYVSYGPLIEPAVMFGSELKVKPGVPFPLAFSLRSATGLKQVKLIGAGTVAFTQVFTGEPREARVEFKPTATGTHLVFARGRRRRGIESVLEPDLGRCGRTAALSGTTLIRRARRRRLSGTWSRLTAELTDGLVAPQEPTRQQAAEITAAFAVAAWSRRHVFHRLLQAYRQARASWRENEHHEHSPPPMDCDDRARHFARGLRRHVHDRPLNGRPGRPGDRRCAGQPARRRVAQGRQHGHDARVP